MDTPATIADRIRVDPALHLVIAAENALARAWQRLNTLRLRAFHGGRYDSDEYDLAVRDYRAAEGTLRRARIGWQTNPARPLGASTAATPVDVRSTHDAKAA